MELRQGAEAAGRQHHHLGRPRGGQALERVGGKTIESAKFKTPGSKDLVIDTEGFYKPSAAGAYPIVLATYEIVCSKYSDAEVGKGLKTFLKVAASKQAQDQLEGQGYAPIPESFRTTLNESIDSIQ